MEKKNTLIRNIFRVLSANFYVAAVGFLGSFIFPRILSIDSYAYYHTFTLYLTYITITTVGFPSGMAVKYAGKDYSTIDVKQYKSEMKILITILCIFSLLFAGVAFIIKNEMFFYVALAEIPVCLIGSYKSLLQSWSRFKDFSRISITLALTVPLSALLFYCLFKELTGRSYIFIYLIVYWAVSLIILREIVVKIFRVKANSVFSVENFGIEKTGVALLVGNYINTLFVSVDKQFVRWFFGNTEFAFYSFAMSMQSLMTVFITSIAHPLFPAMAQGKFKDEEYNDIKKLLLIFGSFSGCAYFAVSIIVKLFITKYINSLSIVGIYFAVFPAMAVINCLYINMYKLKNMMKTYIATLFGILCVAIVLNIIFINLVGSFTGVAIATTITYYVWFFVGTKQFSFFKFELRDFGYLVTYVIGFFGMIRTLNDYVGVVVYFGFVIAIGLVFYRGILFKFIPQLIKRK